MESNSTVVVNNTTDPWKYAEISRTDDVVTLEMMMMSMNMYFYQSVKVTYIFER